MTLLCFKWFTNVRVKNHSAKAVSWDNYRSLRKRSSTNSRFYIVGKRGIFWKMPVDSGITMTLVRFEWFTNVPSMKYSTNVSRNNYRSQRKRSSTNSRFYIIRKRGIFWKIPIDSGLALTLLRFEWFVSGFYPILRDKTAYEKVQASIDSRLTLWAHWWRNCSL